MATHDHDDGATVVYHNFRSSLRARLRASEHGDGRDDGPEHASKARTLGVQGVDEIAGSSPAAILRTAINRVTDARRRERGRTYYTEGRVRRLRFVPGGIAADVVGSHKKPFHVFIRMPERTQDELRECARTVGSWGAREYETLLLRPNEMLGVLCDCPDPTEHCKHVYAVCEAAARKMSDDPSSVALVRGLTSASMALMASQRPLRAVSDDYWAGDHLPPLPTVEEDYSVLEQSDRELLDAALRAVSRGTLEELRLIAEVEDMYYYLMHQGR